MAVANTRLFKRITNVHWRSGTFVVKMIFRAHTAGTSFPLTTYKIGPTTIDITSAGFFGMISGDAFVFPVEPPTKDMIDHLYAWAHPTTFSPPDGGTGVRPFMFYNEVHENTINLNLGKIDKDFPATQFVDIAIPAMHGSAAQIHDEYIVYLPNPGAVPSAPQRFGANYPQAPVPPAATPPPGSLWIASFSTANPDTYDPILIACDADDAMRSVGSPQAGGLWLLGVGETHRGPAPNLPVHSTGGASDAQFVADNLNADSAGGGPIATSGPYFGVVSRSINQTSVRFDVRQIVLPQLDASWTIQFKLYSWDASHGLTLLDTVNRSASGQSISAQNLRLAVKDNRLLVT
jgi:hypothetical protein